MAISSLESLMNESELLWQTSNTFDPNRSSRFDLEPSQYSSNRGESVFSRFETFRLGFANGRRAASISSKNSIPALSSARRSCVRVLSETLILPTAINALYGRQHRAFWRQPISGPGLRG
jgi:hypothetical protein